SKINCFPVRKIERGDLDCLNLLMEQLINFIIRPPRAEYNPKNDLLDEEFVLKGKWHQRKDLEVVNSRGDTLQCSHYMPIVRPNGNPLPCVIYCHGNSGCRTEAIEAATILLPSNITVFTLDFSGSGISGGEHVTLGWNEKDDLKAVVDYLRADGNISLIGLWGRSMGAVTSLMYGAEDPSIAGMVLDSPFSDLVDLMMELVDTYKVRLPKFTVKFAIQFMRRAIQKKVKFDITDLNAIKVAKSCFVPVLFGHATDDDFIQPHHSDRIFDAYVGDKNIIKFEGDHNSPRPEFYFDSISIFFNNVLHPPEDEVGSAYFDATHDYIPKGSWNIFRDMEFTDDLLDSPTGPATSCSTEDSIRKLRSRKPTSMIVVGFKLNLEDTICEVPSDALADFPSNGEEEEKA
ncbi:alpha/beta-Hydrolases superfamily protein, partial [Striga asiatica]